MISAPASIDSGETCLAGHIDVHGAGNPVSELLAELHRLHPNILIIGGGGETERALESIYPTLRPPVALWTPLETAHLPAPAFRTLIVRDVDGLTAAQQASLAGLVRRSAGEVQIVSIARVPFFPLVTQGLFLDELYYRLNVVVLEPGPDGISGW
jgi:hypothetical protein